MVEHKHYPEPYLELARHMPGASLEKCIVATFAPLSDAESANEVRYAIHVPATMHDWFLRHTSDGCMMGLVMALVLRMDWHDVAQIKFGDILSPYTMEIYIPKDVQGQIKIYTMEGAYLAREMAIERMMWLQRTYGYGVAAMMELPVTCGDNPHVPAETNALQQLCSRWLQAFDGIVNAKHYHVSEANGAED